MSVWHAAVGLFGIYSKWYQYGMQQCVYLGFTVRGGILKPEVGKLQAIQQLPVPKTKCDVRAFLGITGHYCKFIPDYATKAVPLTNLTKKNAPNKVAWTEQCNQARQNLKGILCSSPVLRTPDFSCQFILQTDASDYGVGAVLSQRDNNGDDKPVVYYSKNCKAQGTALPCGVSIYVTHYIDNIMCG